MNAVGIDVSKGRSTVAILLMICGYSTGGTVRKVKTDEKDAGKIAQFALDHWVDLREYTHMDAVRQQLKICSRQYDLYVKMGVSLQNNLISLCDKVFVYMTAGANKFLRIYYARIKEYLAEQENQGAICP